uniref:Alpha-amylase n=1 Tax=Trichuris muris TaxID=70415 RepID=A0A5S6QPW1_TRIMR
MLLLYIICQLLAVQSTRQEDCYDALQVPEDQSTVVHLFEWKWDDIAAECENYLQYTGIGAVQVSPPNEHAIFEVNGDRPWRLRYQPVSYKLESRSGTEQQFADMVKRCHKVGIRIIVDAVINHMTGANMSGQGSGGSYYNSTPFKESFSAVPYSAEDFNDEVCNRNIENYNDPWEVRNCRLVSLLDLKLSRPEVQEKIATYLNHLIDLGVAGFRIDAAKHMYPDDIERILKRLKKLNTEFFPPGKCPFIVHEVIDQGPESIKGSEYTRIGRITNFRYGLDLSAAVNHVKNFMYYENFGEGWAYWASHDVLVFIDNHDSQRGSGGEGAVLTYRNGDRYIMAVSFMLAWPYGLPRIMSSYCFKDHDGGPPSTGSPYFITKSPSFKPSGECDQASGWVCEHRWPAIKRMTFFRSAVVDQPVGNSITEDNRIAFSRGNKGFFALNNDPKQAWTRNLKTGLQPGLYCDMISGEVNGQTCTGKSAIVNKDGTTDLFLRSGEALAISSVSLVSLPPSYKHTIIFVRKETSFGQNVFLRGGNSKHTTPAGSGLKVNTDSAIPIVHIADARNEDVPFKEWRKNDATLNWHGSESFQGLYKNESALGSPLLWTTDNKLRAEFNAHNKYGDHFWMLDVMMDCSKTSGGWFEFKAITNTHEISVKQTKCTENGDAIKLPYTTENNLGLCGYVNVYDFSQLLCKFEKV